MRYLSLFSGIGGVELGIQQAYEHIRSTEDISETTKRKEKNKAIRIEEGQIEQLSEHTPYGLSCVGFSEIDKYATAIYQSHFPEHKNYGDITKLNTEELPDFDFLCGGFPCQAFSIAGKRKGFEDTRGTLFFEIARILRAKQPRLFLLENVKGLLSHDNGKTFSTIISTLDELGYDLQWQVLNSKNFGVPQNRERVFIVGHLRGTSRPQVFPFGETSDRILEQDGGLRGEVCDNEKGGDKSDNHGKILQDVINRPLYLRQILGGSQGERVYDPEGVSVTLAGQAGGHGAKTGLYLKDMKIRRLTPTECERLQGFPDGWTEKGLSSIMEVCVNINPVIEKRLLELGTVSSITSDGSGMVFPISQNECKEPVGIVLEELLPEDSAINTISHGNAMATLFNQSGTLLNATQLKENLTSERMVVKSTCKLWKVRLLGHYEKEKLSTILTWINETMQSITSISARTDENIIGVIILLNSQESSFSNGESLCLRMGNIESISDTQRYKTLGNAVTVNVIEAIVDKLVVSTL